MARFLQIHTLTSYPGSLLNRDDVGFAKRLPFGGADRVRISSQCLKRHWRTVDSELSLASIKMDGDTVPVSVRSRRTFERHVYEPLVADGVPAEIAKAVTAALIESVLGESKRKKATKAAETASDDDDDLKTSQVTVIGRPEVRYLLDLARKASASATDVEDAKRRWKDLVRGDLAKNLSALRHGAGVDAAMFGRMVTGDVLSRSDAAVHVAHAFTVHKGFFETDYFSAVDDLNPEGETGSGHINTAELTTGLYYGYVVVDLPLLVSNLEGCPRSAWLEADRSLAAEVVRRLIHLIATVSPGAKLGSTAPHARALFVLLERGDSLPRTLANAFIKPVPARSEGGLVEEAVASLARHLAQLDGMYGREEERRFAALDPVPALEESDVPRLDLPSLAGWAADVLRAGA